MKNKKVLLIARLMNVLSVKVPLRSCYGAGEFGLTDIKNEHFTLFLLITNGKCQAKYSRLVIEKKNSAEGFDLHFFQLLWIIFTWMCSSSRSFLCSFFYSCILRTRYPTNLSWANSITKRSGIRQVPLYW